MRIAFLCKRRYMGKDVILDRYARLYEIPFQLARLGNHVQGHCLDYYGCAGVEHWEQEVDNGFMEWNSESIRGRQLFLLSRYPWRLLKKLRDFRPDWLIGASDIPHVALTGWLARQLDVPYAADLYDNFEGYGQARIPGFVTALRRATRNASLVLTTSEPLRQMVIQDYGAKGHVLSMPSSVDLGVFFPGDKIAARKKLGLPLHARLIGTAGGLYADKGIEPVYQAWNELAAKDATVHLVLAGPYRKELVPPHGERVHYLGHLDHAQVADMFRALDIGIISILDTLFGRYCFPQKAYEMLACGLHVVVTDIGEMSEIFKETPQITFPAGDANALTQALLSQLAQPAMPVVPVRDWQSLIQDIEPLMKKLTRSIVP